MRSTERPLKACTVAQERIREAVMAATGANALGKYCGLTSTQPVPGGY